MASPLSKFMRGASGAMLDVVNKKIEDDMLQKRQDRLNEFKSSESALDRGLEEKLRKPGIEKTNLEINSLTRDAALQKQLVVAYETGVGIEEIEDKIAARDGKPVDREARTNRKKVRALREEWGAPGTSKARKKEIDAHLRRLGADIQDPASLYSASGDNIVNRLTGETTRTPATQEKMLKHALDLTKLYLQQQEDVGTFPYLDEDGYSVKRQGPKTTPNPDYITVDELIKRYSSQNDVRFSADDKLYMKFKAIAKTDDAALQRFMKDLTTKEKKALAKRVERDK